MADDDGDQVQAGPVVVRIHLCIILYFVLRVYLIFSISVLYRDLLTLCGRLLWRS